MEVQFQMDCCLNSGMLGGRTAVPVLEPNPVGQFTNGLPADDPAPDPLFFEESWTLGAPVAAERWQLRRKEQADQERRGRSFRELDARGTLFFVQEREWLAKRFSNEHAVAVASWPPRPSEEPSGQAEDQAPQAGEAFSEKRGRRWETAPSMTPQRACRLLGVTSASTREQVKAAYRRLAAQWHPDRFASATKEALGLANDQMAAINEAYRVMRICFCS